MVSTYSLGCGEGIWYWLVRMKAPASYLAFFDTFGQGIGELYYNSLARRGSLDSWWQMRHLLWCLSGIERLLSKSFVWRVCLFSGALGSESRFCCGFFVCLHWRFQIVGFFSSKSGMYEIKRKPRELTTASFFGSQVSSQLAFFSSPFKTYLGWFVLLLFF